LKSLSSVDEGLFFCSVNKSLQLIITFM